MQYCYRKCDLSNWPYTCTVDDNKPFVLNNEIRKQNTFNLIVAIIRLINYGDFIQKGSVKKSHSINLLIHSINLLTKLNIRNKI